MKRSPFTYFSLAAALLFSIISPALADVKMPGFFGDHMVLQRQAPIPIWGWAEAKEEITVQLGEGKVTAVADASGKWKVKLPAQEANSKGQVLTISSSNNSVKFNDVLIGEVWLCSGQSNMEWTVTRSNDSEKEIAAADFPLIRHLKIGHKTSGVPLDDVSGIWELCSPETVGDFTAAGYFMGRELHQKLGGIPIGLLNNSWGGTRVEPWTPIEGFAEVPALSSIHQQISQTLPGNPLYQSAAEKHLAASELWLKEAKAAAAKNEAIPANPAFPENLSPLKAHTSPTAIYNAMMSPMVGYGMRGAIWYQGESNHTEGMLYFEKKKALIAGWRKLWGIGDFPFYFVQIAPYRYNDTSPSVLANFWEAQSACLQIPNTGMVVINDIGNIKDIHPKNKQEVGRRLSLLALKNQYGKSDLVASGPVFDSLEIKGDKMHVKFSSAGEGLKARDGKALSHFEIIGEQAEFVTATATVSESGDTIILSSPEVKKPAAMRFAWHNLAEPNLINSAGLPASTFRAGKIPKYDFLNLKIEEAAEYELVYEVDLKKLRGKTPYTIDRSSEISGDFDRVAYFIDLNQGDGQVQWAWTSMDAFTKDLKKIGLPRMGTGIFFQNPVQNLNVLSNVGRVTSGKGLTGNMEFWPNNYGPSNVKKVPGASSNAWDFGDETTSLENGYGSMQIHNTAAKQTVFAVNHWNSDAADLGIGNSSGKSLDWTFSGSGASVEAGKLRILVRKTAK